jgi:hypothetical protein
MHASMLLWLQAFLIDGMESLSQAKVGSALQVFFNLEELQQVSWCCSNAPRCTRQQTLAAPAVLQDSAVAGVDLHAGDVHFGAAAAGEVAEQEVPTGAVWAVEPLS